GLPPATWGSARTVPVLHCGRVRTTAAEGKIGEAWHGGRADTQAGAPPRIGDGADRPRGPGARRLRRAEAQRGRGGPGVRRAGGTEAAAVSAGPVSLVLNTSWVAPGVRGQVVEEGLAEYKQRFPQVSVTIAPLGGDNPTLQVLMASDSVGDVAEWDHKLIVY